MGTKLVEDTNNLKDCFRSLFEVCTEHAYCIFRILLDLDWHYLNAGASNRVFYLSSQTTTDFKHLKKNHGH